VKPQHFDNKKGTIRYKADFLTKDEIDKKLRDLKNHIFDNLALRSSPPDKEWLLKTIDDFHNPPSKVKEEISLFSFIQDFIEKAPVRIIPNTGRPVTYKQVREYERTFYYLKAFAKSKRKKLDFPDIDLDFYDEFVKYLQELNLAKNTIGKKIQTLRIFLNAASVDDLPVNPQYKSHRFKAFTEKSESIYLTEDELEKLYKLNLSKRPGLDRVRDLFLVGCWTGLRFSDWNQVRPENIDGDFLELEQSKTGDPVVIPLHSTVIAILDKYNGELPRVMTNQKFNEALKEVAEKAKLNDSVHISITRGGVKTSKAYQKHELVTTHTARRSFATNLYKAGLPTFSIMQVTGHKSESAFLKYIKVTPREHAEKLKQFWHDQVKLKVV
jgi:integrase